MSCVKTLQTINAAVVHSNQILEECNDISGCYGQQWDFLPAVFYTKPGMISDFSLYVFCNQSQYLAYAAMTCRKCDVYLQPKWLSAATV